MEMNVEVQWSAHTPVGPEFGDAFVDVLRGIEIRPAERRLHQYNYIIINGINNITQEIRQGGQMLTLTPDL